MLLHIALSMLISPLKHRRTYHTRQEFITLSSSSCKVPSVYVSATVQHSRPSGRWHTHRHTYAHVGTAVLFASANHTYEDVAAAVELAVDVDLREGRPLAVLLHAAAQALVLQDVDRREGRLQLVEDLRQPVTRAVSAWRPS